MSFDSGIRLPELNGESFIALYPLLPYQIDLIISVVSGLRTQGGGSHHVGGANQPTIPELQPVTGLELRECVVF